MKAFVNGKHDRKGNPLYSLKEISAASELPVYAGERADVVFNWGGAFPYRPKAKIVLNERPLFGKCAQALAMLRGGVATPKAYRTLREVKSFPVLQKPNESHGGKGIKIIKTRPAKFVQRGNVWFQQYIEKWREYRVYFFDGEVTMVSEKIVKDKSRVIWNIINCVGWERKRSLESNKELTALVLESAKAVRLDWGAADVIQDKKAKFWLCEINSRPSCWNRERPKLEMKCEKGVWKLTNNYREELSLSARMWGNRMQRFLRKTRNN